MQTSITIYHLQWKALATTFLMCVTLWRSYICFSSSFFPLTYNLENKLFLLKWSSFPELQLVPLPRLPKIDRKPLSWGHLAITDKMLVPKGVHYRGVPLYRVWCAKPGLPSSMKTLQCTLCYWKVIIFDYFMISYLLYGKSYQCYYRLLWHIVCLPR